MVKTDIQIIARTPFVDSTDPAKPVQKIDIAFQTPDGRVGTATILAADLKKPKEDEAIAAAIKLLPSTVFERKEIDVL